MRVLPAGACPPRKCNFFVSRARAIELYICSLFVREPGAAARRRAHKSYYNEKLKRVLGAAACRLEESMDEEFDMPQSEENESEIIRERHERRRAKRRRIHKRRKIIRRVLFGVFLLFLMTYFSMVLYTSNFSVMETEQADFFEYNDGLDVEAFAVRSEEYITNSKKGIISYTVDDGEKINAGGYVGIAPSICAAPVIMFLT